MLRRRLGSADDPRIAAIEGLLRSPDREHPWGTWVRMLLEDLFVLDAPTLYVRCTATGALWGLEVIGGATVKRLLGPDGRTARAPDPAYQQVLKGVPAIDYTADELIYAPRNPRPHKVYGYSPVEEILMTVNIGLRRQVSQLNYFTEGNTPEALIGVPEEWTPDQIRQFQDYWGALLEGNIAARRLVPREFSTISNGRPFTGIADQAAIIDGKATEIEAKYVYSWPNSPRNPASPNADFGWAIQGRQNMLDQASSYSENFPGGVIYHTNNRDFVTYYSTIFKSSGIRGFRFIITPTN